MEKVLKTVKIVTITLIVILLSIIAVCGTYANRNNVWRKTMPEYNYGIELTGSRELRYVLDTSEEEKNVYIDSEGNILGEVIEEESSESEEATENSETATEEKVEEDKTEEKKEDEDKPNYATEVRKIKANEDSAKTIENFEKAKSIIQERLENEEVYEYNIRLDTITGELILEIPNDDNVSVAHAAVSTIGNLEMIDAQNGMILLDKSDVKKVESGVYQEDIGYQAYLLIYFNDEGAEKLKRVSNEYRQVVNDAGESTTYYIALNLDGQTITQTYFGEELSNGVIQIPIGNPTTDSATINETLIGARRMANVINKEKLPIVYTLESDSIVESRITEKDMQMAFIIFAIVIFVVSVIFIVKFKGKGLVSAILGIGYIAILSLVARYTGIYITINSAIAFIGMIVLNYVFIKIFLLELKNNQNLKEAFLSTMKKYYLTIIPICIIAIIFTFASNITINSIGMILFWGLLLQVIYNAITILGLALI